MNRINPYLLGATLGLVSMAGAIFGGCAWSDHNAETRPPAAAPKMTFAECQASAEYPGGRYAVEYDNGVCTVQKP